MEVVEKGEAVTPSYLPVIKFSDQLSDAARDFSLAAGGPLYQLLLRLKLVRPPLDRIGWRVVVITAIAWMPLFVLTILNGRVTSGVHIPFLGDFDAQARLLIGLPLLIGAELSIHRGMRELVHQFVDRQIIRPPMLPRFEACLESALRLRNSVPVELCLLLFIASAEVFWARNVLAIPTDTWYASIISGVSKPTPAGYWYVFVSLPIFQFVWLRWWYRLFIWCRLLWQISRLDLNLIPPVLIGD